MWAQAQASNSGTQAETPMPWIDVLCRRILHQRYEDVLSEHQSCHLQPSCSARCPRRTSLTPVPLKSVDCHSNNSIQSMDIGWCAYVSLAHSMPLLTNPCSLAITGHHWTEMTTFSLEPSLGLRTRTRGTPRRVQLILQHTNWWLQLFGGLVILDYHQDANGWCIVLVISDHR